MITDYSYEGAENKTGIAFGTMLKSISTLKKMGDKRKSIPDGYTYGDVLAGEYAISALQAILTGQYSSDNPAVELALDPLEPSIKKSHELYDNKIAKSEEDMRLEEIAAYRRQGFSYSQIEKEMEIPRSTIQYRVSLIERNHPDWLNN